MPARPAGPAEEFRLTGQVLSLQARQPIGGANAELIGFSKSSFATDAAGGFAVDAAAGSLIYTLNAPGFLQRRSALMVSGPRQGVALDMISLEAPFSLDFYREFVRDSLEHPSGGYSPTHPWPYDPKFYIRTVTEDSGEVVSDAIVNGVRRVLEASVPELSGGRLKVAEIRSGTEPMPRTVGWVQVSWGRDIGPGLGGQASVGFQQDRGIIRLKYYDDPTLNNSRQCESASVYIAEHEIVHTMGYFHTTLVIGDFHPAGLGCPGAGRAPRVAYHAAIMYSRPAGNRDPDHDPAGFTTPASVPEPIVIRCGVS